MSACAGYVVVHFIHLAFAKQARPFHVVFQSCDQNTEQNDTRSFSQLKLSVSGSVNLLLRLYEVVLGGESNSIKHCGFCRGQEGDF